MGLLIDKKFIEKIKKNKLPTSKYIHFNSENNAVETVICYSINYDDEGGYIYGAYYGMCGGGEADGGFFTIDCSQSDAKHYDYSAVESLSQSSPLLKEILEFMMSRVWELIQEDDGQLVFTEQGRAEFDDNSEDDVGLINDFDGDLLCEVSEQWNIPVHFEF